MSMDHDGKLNTTPMIDEEIEQALLDLMDKETPDLWNRIMAGLDAPNAPSGFDDIVGEADDVGNVPETEADDAGNVPETEAGETVGSTFAEADETVGSTFATADDTVQSGDNVVPFRAKEDKAENSGSSNKSVKPGRSRAMSRVWGNLIAAAVVLIIISVPVSRLILNQKKSDTAESTQAVTQSTTTASDSMAGAAEDDYYEEAVAESVGEMVPEAENEEREDGAKTSNAVKSEGADIMYESTTQAAYDTEAATEAAAEATEASIEEIEGFEGNTTAGGTLNLDGKTKNIYGITDRQYLNVRKYAGTFNKDTVMQSIQTGFADASIEARIVVRDGEYYLVDYIDVSGETESEEYSEGEIRIANPEDAGIPQLLEVEGYTEDTRYRFSVKYPEKNNENEVEIVEILSIE